MVTRRLLKRLLLLALLAPAGTLHAAAPAQRAADIRDLEAQYYRMTTLPTPRETTLEAGDMAFMTPDKLALSDRFGEIYIADGVLGDPAKIKWSLYASGLHEVLGLAYKDGWLYAMQRPELTRLRDTKGTGHADLFETVTDDWGINGDYHEYALCSKFDRDGNIWVLLTLTSSDHSGSPMRGFGYRVAPDGKATPVVSGLRSPGGVGFNAEGDIFYTDNQGYWNGTSPMHQLKVGDFEGNPSCYKWFDDPLTRDRLAKAGLCKPAPPTDGGRLYEDAKRIPNLNIPCVYFPYKKMGQSASGIICDLTGGKFGPFEKQLFVNDQEASIVMRVFLEKVNGRYQGACFPFREGFDSGNLALQFGANGALFVYGTSRGWGSRGGKAAGLQRLEWTGVVPFEVKEMHAAADGFDFTFTQPIDPKSLANPGANTISTYTYIYQSTYGSPEVDVTRPVIKSIMPGRDGLTAHMVIDGLVPGHVHELHLTGLRSAQGAPLLHDAAYYTLNSIPAK